MRFSLSEAATTTFTVQRAVRGRSRYRKLRGSFKRANAAGRSSFRFTGRLRGRALKKGRYRLVAVSRDRAGNKSKPSYRRFRIVR